MGKHSRRRNRRNRNRKSMNRECDCTLMGNFNSDGNTFEQIERDLVGHLEDAKEKATSKEEPIVVGLMARYYYKGEWRNVLFHVGGTDGSILDEFECDSTAGELMLMESMKEVSGGLFASKLSGMMGGK